MVSKKEDKIACSATTWLVFSWQQVRASARNVGVYAKARWQGRPLVANQMSNGLRCSASALPVSDFFQYKRPAALSQLQLANERQLELSMIIGGSLVDQLRPSNAFLHFYIFEHHLRLSRRQAITPVQYTPLLALNNRKLRVTTLNREKRDLLGTIWSRIKNRALFGEKLVADVISGNKALLRVASVECISAVANNTPKLPSWKISMHSKLF